MESTPTTSRTASALLLERLALVVGELELDDLLDPAGAELHRHADVEAVDPVLALEQRRARQDALLVEEDRVDHLRDRRARRVPGGGAEQLHDLAAALRGALDHLLDPLLGDELAQRDAADGRRRDDGHHLVAVAAEHERLHVAHRGAGLPGDEGAEARGVEDPGLAEDALLREARDALRDVAHRVERVREDDDGAVGALGDDLLGHRADDLLVRRHEVVARHAGRARQAGGDHDDVGAGRLLVAVRAGDLRLEAEHRAHLVQVERLALRQALP